MKRKNNKLTSRILSTALALAFIIAVLPAAFAADKEITIPNVFPFYQNQLGHDVTGDGTRDDIGYDHNSANLNYAATPTDITYAIGNGNVQFYATNTSRVIKWNSNTTQIQLNQSEFAAFKLMGIEKGKYNITLRVKPSNIAADIYIIPLDKEASDYKDIAADEANGIAASTQATNYVNSLLTKNPRPVISESSFTQTGAGTFLNFTAEFTAELTAADSEYLFVVKRTTDSGDRFIYPVALVLEPIEEEKVTYGVFDNIEGSDAVEVQGGEDNKLFGSVAAGTRFFATATDKEGYTFRYWVLGSAATGRYYSSDKTVIVKPYANIALTAIYAQDVTEPVVDLFNFNGAYLKTLKASELASSLSEVQPEMTGYSFDEKWLLPDKTELKADSVITKDTQAVAQFTVVGDYDKPVSSVGTSQTGWMRGEKHVTYNSEYTFFTWLNSVGEIKAYDGEAVDDKIPLAVLEKNGGNFMLEYDEGAYSIVEAGILFGSTAKVDVKSVYSKAIVKNLEKNNGHGQLTATAHPDGTAGMQDYARGYVIYDDNGTIEVVYTNAIEVSQ